MSDSSQEGRRERKKRETREAIALAAARLFSARGFDAVTVADVAEAADVSVQTVYNHFPAKDDLVFDRQAEREALLRERLAAIEPGDPIVPAFRAMTNDWLDRMATMEPSDEHDFFGIVHSSPVLMARLLKMFGDERAVVAEGIARVQGTEVTFATHALANALQGISSMAVGATAKLRSEGRPIAEAVAELRPEVELAFDALEAGLR